MWNAVWLLLFIDSGQIIMSMVVDSGLPTESFLGCKALSFDIDKQVNCVMNVTNKELEETGAAEDQIQLVIHQKFYWHPTKRVRRECRTLSKAEREEVWAAINALKQDTSKEPNVYDWFADFHTKRAVYSVHYGPNFFGWHRVYILKFEELLRKKFPNVTLCYWDSRADHELRDMKLQTVMFTEKFLGNAWGNVKKGPFAGWKTIRGVPLRRDLGAKGSYMTARSTKRILSRRSHEEISNPTAKNGDILEELHNNIHAVIGGQMNDFNTSSQEPAFWIHHSFVDSLWEKFCFKLRQQNIDPQDDFVTKKIPKMHQPNQYMDRLVPYRNIDGYSHYFTNNIYRYEDYPVCENNCQDSKFLRCKNNKNLCVSVTKWAKIKEEENMPRKYRNDLSRPLSDSIILFGESQAEQWVIIPIKIAFPVPIQKFLLNKTIVGCALDDQARICEQSVAIVKSTGLSYHGTFTNYIECDVTIPVWSYAFVAVKNPTLGDSRSFLSVTFKDGKACRPLCLSSDKRKYEFCDGVVDVTADDPKQYYSTLQDAIADGYQFDPLGDDDVDDRVIIKFVCG